MAPATTHVPWTRATLSLLLVLTGACDDGAQTTGVHDAGTGGDAATEDAGPTTDSGADADASSDAGTPPAPDRSYLDLSLSPGTTYYVDGVDGDNGNSGLNPDQAWKDVVYAQTQVSPGDKVSLAGPINPINQQFNITTPGAPGQYITYFVEPGKSAWAEADSYDHYHRIFIETHHIQLHGVHVRHLNNVSGGVHPDSNGILVQGFFDGHQAYNIRIVNNVVSGFGHGIHGGGDYILVAGNEVYENAYYDDRGGSGISWNNGYAAADGSNEFPGYRYAIIGNCAHHNEQKVVSSGIGMDVKSDGNGIIVGDHLDHGGAAAAGPFIIANNVVVSNGGRCVNVWMTSNVDVFNNTCIQNGTHHLSGQSPQQAELAVGGYSPYSVTGVRFFNNLTYRRDTTEQDLVDYGSSTYERDYNTHVNPSQNEAYGPNDIPTDSSVFVSTSASPCGSDWRPQPGASEAVDNGSNAHSVDSRDFDGNPRISGSVVDRGAFELP